VADALNWPQNPCERGEDLEDIKITIDQEEKSGLMQVDNVEFKASDDERGVIEGYASTFGNVDRHGDVITKGAFEGGRSKIPIFAMHDPSMAIGVGFVEEDSKGLKIRMKLAVDNPDSETLRERAREYYAMAKEGIIEKMSVGFIPLEREWKKRKVDGRDVPTRYIKKVDLVEVSLVPIPANDRARVTTVKSFDEDLQDIIREAVRKEFESFTEEQKQEELEQEEQEHEEEEQTEQKDLSALIANRLGLF
jgi:HK97 family phage prohead protease